MSRIRRFRILAGALCAVGVMGSTSAYAVTDTLPTPLTIAATVLKVCIAGIGTPIAMTSLTATSGQTGSGTVVVTCTAGATYDVKLDMGVNAATGAGPTQRRMKSVLGSALVTYGLYQDTAYSAPWGQTVGTDTLHKTGSGIVDTWPVYMKVDTASATSAPAGAYADVVQLSVEY